MVGGQLRQSEDRQTSDESEIAVEVSKSSVVVEIAYLRTLLVATIAAFMAVVSYKMATGPALQGREAKQAVLWLGTVFFAPASIGILLQALAGMAGWPAMRLSGGEVSYINPLPHKVPVSKIKRARWAPERMHVLLETEERTIVVTALLFARKGDAELIVRSINDAIARNTEAASD